MKVNFDKLKLYKDNYNIYNLITKINRGYRLYYCQDEKMFYVINIANHNEICMKFDSFNCNILKNLQISRIENANALFSEIDNNNLKIKNNLQKNCLNKFDNLLAELNSFCKRAGHVSSSQINKIIEENNA